MSERIDAIFENGVFLPQVPVSIPDGSQVNLYVATKPLCSRDDLDDVQNLLNKTNTWTYANNLNFLLQLWRRYETFSASFLVLSQSES